MLLLILLVMSQWIGSPATAGNVSKGDQDIVFENFETDGYARWEVFGSAFGTEPASGKIKSQKEVDGFEGKRLVNSYLGGDKATGRLLSAPFRIDRDRIAFLIGGGYQPESLGIRLWVDGRMVRSETGGDSEVLVQKFWDVRDLKGKEARIEIVDQATGGWGHINVDEIVFTNRVIKAKKECVRWVKVSGDFLQLPLMQRDKGLKAGVERLTVEKKSADKGTWQVLRYVHLEFPLPGNKPDFWYSYDMRAFKGQEVLLRFRSWDTTVLDRLEFSDKEMIDPQAYAGKYRPRFHFSPRIGWMNDVNGVYYLKGEYHLFYQANPTTAGRSTGFDMHWGHSVSTDLLHWKELPIALFPNELPGQAGKCYSGSSVVVKTPIRGVTDGIQVPTPVLMFTANSNQLLATTRDKGYTWDRFPGNPVLPIIGKASRDPRVFWHDASQSYIMLLYVDKESEGMREGYRFLRSDDLVHWKQTSILNDWYECPEFIPVRSSLNGERLWLLYGCYRPAGGPKYTSAYQLGKFDGYRFTPVGEVQPAHGGTSFYGALCFSNEPAGRNIMMGWMKNTVFPGENFNQCATVPLLLSLKNKGGKDCLCFEPVSEVTRLRKSPLIKLHNVGMEAVNEAFAKFAPGECADVVMRITPSKTHTFTLRIRGKEWVFKNDSIVFEGIPRPVHTGKDLEVRILLDRGIAECFWNGGEVSYAVSAVDVEGKSVVGLDGGIESASVTVYPMSGIWN